MLVNKSINDTLKFKCFQQKMYGEHQDEEGVGRKSVRFKTGSSYIIFM